MSKLGFWMFKESSEYDELRKKIEQIEYGQNLDKKRRQIAMGILKKHENEKARAAEDLSKKIMRVVKDKDFPKGALFGTGAVMGGLDAFEEFKKMQKRKSFGGSIGKGLVLGAGALAYLKSKGKNDDKTAMEKNAGFANFIGKMHGGMVGSYNKPLGWLERPLAAALRGVNRKSRALSEDYRRGMLEAAAKKGYYIDPYLMAGKVPQRQHLNQMLIDQFKTIDPQRVSAALSVLQKNLGGYMQPQQSGFSGFMDNLPPVIKQYGVPFLAGAAFTKLFS